MKRQTTIAILILLTLALGAFEPAPLIAGEQVIGVAGCVPLGKATYTPNTVTTFADTPDAGIALPDKARWAFVTIRTAAINWTLTGDAVADTDQSLPVGSYMFDYDRKFLENFSFIDGTAGISQVDVEWCGEGSPR